MMRGSLITCLSFLVLSSTITRADSWFLALHTANQTSSPPLLYSGCTTRLAPSPRPAHSAIGSVTGFLDRSLMSNTAIDCATFGSGLSGVSTQRFLDFGWVLMKRLPPPCPSRYCTTFQ